MADTNHIRRDDYAGFSENDPFAELTRIMGHDPRAPEQAPQAAEAAPYAAQAAASPVADDFAIDLEKELAGDFDFSDFDDQAPFEDHVPAADWREDVASRAEEEASSVALDANFDDFFAEALVDEPVANASPAAPVEAYAPGAYAPDPLEESLDDALERELFSDAQDLTGEDLAAPGSVAFDAPASEPEPEWTGYHAPADTPADEPSHDEPAGFDAPVVGEVEDDWTAEAEFDLDLLEKELAASAGQTDAATPQAFAPVAPEPAASGPVAPEHAAAVEDFSFHDEPEAPAEPAAPQGLSLEEELNLLLADDPVPAAPVHASASSSSSPYGSYGRANFAAAASGAAAASAAASAFARHETTTAAPSYARPEEPATRSYEAVAAPTPVFGEAYSQESVEDDLPDGLLDDDFDFSLDTDEDTAEPAAAVHSAAVHDALPEIETVEVAEAVQPVADDLDIPEIDYGVPEAAAAAPFDEFEAEFADVFGDAVKDEPVSAAAAVAAAAPAPQAQPYELDDAQWHDAQAFPDADFDYESDLEQAISMSAYDDEEARPAPRRRGLLVAAIVAGVAVLGGIGVFGMSMFGGGSDAPALVRADSEPMKVRPENPGGATVPNQDNEVYQRVAGSGSEAPPAQERLITTAEEPVDVARTVSPQEPALLAPGIEDEAFAGQPKSEDRIEPEAQATSPVSADDAAVVTPRRVRTMVVRPDGTMVPREEIAPAAVEQPVAGDQPAIAAPPVLAQPIGQAQGLPVTEPVSEIDEGPTIDMPQTVAVVPTQRTEPQAAVAPARPAAPAAQPAVQQPARQPAAPAPVAAAPVAAAPAAAAAGEWSMQIASQPTAEGAQSTYQDLARRYSGVLQGRGVNIVRADIEGRGTYYRVRIPASNRDEAIQLCTRYKAAGGSCFVSR